MGKEGEGRKCLTLIDEIQSHVKNNKSYAVEKSCSRSRNLEDLDPIDWWRQMTKE